MVMVMASSAATTSTSSSTLLLRLLCLCTVLPVTLQAARPTNITIGALFAFDSVIGRSARTAIQLAVDDVNRDPTVLSGTNLSVIFQDTKCSGFVATIQGTSLSLSLYCIPFVSTLFSAQEHQLHALRPWMMVH
jgi:ionotropic glutamate receptor